MVNSIEFPGGAVVKRKRKKKKRQAANVQGTRDAVAGQGRSTGVGNGSPPAF